jgi:uncharacterized protein (TIGR00251 family)
MSGLHNEILQKCIEQLDDGVLVNIEVKPQSKAAGIEGIDDWRKYIKVRIKAKAQKGKANKELIQLLSSKLSLSPSNFIIVNGLKSTRKTIKISGITKKEIINILIHKVDIG